MSNIFGDLGTILGNDTLSKIGSTSLGELAGNKVLNTSVQPEIREIRTESSPMQVAKNYTPWIIGTVAILALGAIFFLRKK